MYQIALLDHNEKTPLNRQRFYSCVKLVADECLPATFYVHADWMRHDFIEGMGWDADHLSELQENILLEHDLMPKGGYGEAPYLATIVGDDWKNRGEDSGLPVRVPDRDFVLSDSKIVNKAHFLSAGLNPNTSILTLAAVGIDLMLPNVNFDLFADDEIDKLKEQFAEERANYLSTISSMAEASYEGLRTVNYEEVFDWAQTEVEFKLVPKARALEVAIQKASAKTLKRAGFSFWQDGIPAIGAAYFTGGLISVSKAAAVEGIRSIVSAISEDQEKRRLPEYAYAMKIASAKS